MLPTSLRLAREVERLPERVRAHWRAAHEPPDDPSAAQPPLAAHRRGWRRLFHRRG
ncbi:hypothetical protein [Luedemannella helvata]|uniref:Uncharacterized protein n=1 Tax=Luedemannella helvata TaxID=349315 RepID=A0ABP4X5N6_9ACTN